MAVPRVASSLAKVVLVAALVLPPAAIWLSGRFGDDTERPSEPPGPAPRATVVRSVPPATPVARPVPAPDSLPSPAPPVTVGPGTVTVPPAVPGATGAPVPREGQVIGEPRGIPDPDQSEATPR